MDRLYSTILANELTLYLFFLLAQVLAIYVILKYSKKKYSNLKNYKIYRYLFICLILFVTTPDSLIINAFNIVMNFIMNKINWLFLLV